MITNFQINVEKYDDFSSFQNAIDALTSLDTNKNIIVDATSSKVITIRQETLWEKFLAWIRWKPKGLRLENVKTVVKNFLNYNQENLIRLNQKNQIKLLALHLFKKEQPESLKQMDVVKKLKKIVKENEKLIREQKGIIEKKKAKIKEINDEKSIARMKLVARTPIPMTINSDTLSVLKTLRNDPKKADLFILTSDGKEISAERRFLPPFFNNETLEQMKEKEQLGIKIDLSHMVDSETVNLFLDFEYGIPIQQNLTIDQLMKLYEFADYVGEQKLKKEILNILLNQINEKTWKVIFSILIDFDEQNEIKEDMFISLKSHIEKMDLPLEAWMELYQIARNNNAKKIQKEIIDFMIGKLNNKNYHFVNNLMSLLDEANDRVAWTALVPWDNEKLQRFMILAKVDQKFFSTMEEFANKGDAWAQYRVGACYANGFGIQQNKNAAITWLRLGEKNGEICNIRSCNLLVDHYQQQRKFKESFNLLQKIHTDENAPANIKYNLALHYHNGWGTNKDLDKARKFYIEAAGLGHTVAKRCLEKGLI